MDGRRDDLLDEAILRRALRLEADERAPRFDPVAIAAIAPPRPAAALLAALLVVLAVALTATALWTAAIMNAAAIASIAAEAALAVFAHLASFLYPLAQAAADPAVPLSLLLGLGFAIYHETTARREPVHAEAS